MSRPRKRKRGRRLATLGLVGALGAAIYWFLQFSGAGVGLPGLPGLPDKERADTEPSSDAAAQQVPPCELRVDREGVQLEGESVDVEVAVASCRQAGEAILTVTGDARYGTFEQTRDALEQAGVTVRVVR